MILKGFEFNPIATFECGQCFRWERHKEGYIGVVENWIVSVQPKGADYVVSVLNDGKVQGVLERYFDCETDYLKMDEVLSQKDAHLKEAVSLYHGMRLLRQDPFETLMSFIISANNNIPKIKMAVTELSERFGDYLGTIEGRDYYSFPVAEVLANETLESLSVKGIGYRNKGVLNTCKRIVETSFNLEELKSMSFETARQELETFYGVGEKVANCVLLFSLDHREAFPIDTWMKRMLRELYGVEDHPKAYATFAKSYFTQYSGYAQQLLFYYMRQNRGGKS